MDLTHKIVRHSTFGVGIISKHEVDKITVEFDSVEHSFTYPDAFFGYLKFEDTALQSAFLKEIDKTKVKEQLETSALIAEETEKKNYFMSKINESFHTRPSHQHPTNKITKNHKTFLVFQGKTFATEFHGGYIWAPISSKGYTFHHWDRMLDVRPGDIILHNRNGYIQAISSAKGDCYENKQPKELQIEGLWDLDGRRVDCDYLFIKQPIRTANYIKDILKYRPEKYSPFTKYGKGNMGYLYELNRELAKIFIKDSIEQNPELGTIQYIKEVFAESNAK